MAAADILSDPNAVLRDQISWRHGKVPDYTAANRKYFAERSVVHPEDSLEWKISCLVKNWEKEVSFKQDPSDFRTLDPAKWTISVNGGRSFTLDDILTLGSYSCLIGDQAFFCSSKLGFKDSHDTFRKAMPMGFSWEVLQVWSGPPRIAFKWRHWGSMTGRLKCPLSNGMQMIAQPTMKEHTMSGCAYCELDEQSRMTKLELFFDQQQPMASMVRYGEGLAAPSENGSSSTIENGSSTKMQPPAPVKVPSASRASSTGRMSSSGSKAPSQNASPRGMAFNAAFAASRQGTEDGSSTGQGFRSMMKGLRGLFAPREESIKE